MRVVAMIALAVLIETSAQAYGLTVYVAHGPLVPLQVLSRAQELANDIFRGVGVQIDWCGHEPSRSHWDVERPIIVEMVNATRRDPAAPALASSFPYEGVHINVFYDRVKQTVVPELGPTVLAYVLVHEITHILQGTSRHSDTGVMKARWNNQDYRDMRYKHLSFAESDVRLIQMSVVARASGGTPIAAALDRKSR